jgi:hypothetical protein
MPIEGKKLYLGDNPITLIKDNGFVAVDPLFVSPTDPDADAFIAAVEGGGDTLTTTEKSAIDTLVTTFKSDGIWTKMQAIYPMVGGTSSAMKWNLKDPRDLDAAYRMSWTATNWTFSANGAQAGDTNNEYGNTHFACNENSLANGQSLSIYVNGGTTATGYDLATSDGVNQETGIIAGFGNNLAYTKYGYATWLTDTQTGMPNKFIHSSGNGSGTELYVNGTQEQTNATARDITMTTNFYLGNKSGVSNQPTDRRYAFVHLGTYMDSTDHSNLYTAVQAFNTTLGRNN